MARPWSQKERKTRSSPHCRPPYLTIHVHHILDFEVRCKVIHQFSGVFSLLEWALLPSSSSPPDPDLTPPPWPAPSLSYLLSSSDALLFDPLPLGLKYNLDDDLDSSRLGKFAELEDLSDDFAFGIMELADSHLSLRSTNYRFTFDYTPTEFAPGLAKVSCLPASLSFTRHPRPNCFCLLASTQLCSLSHWSQAVTQPKLPEFSSQIGCTHVERAEFP